MHVCYSIKDVGNNKFECYKNDLKFFESYDWQLAVSILENEIGRDEIDKEADNILKTTCLEESINLFEEQLYEMASVKSKTIPNGLLLAVNPDQNRISDAYFKMYDSTKYHKAKFVARISFFEPKLISHRCNDKGKQPWTDLKSYHVKHLEDLLDSESITYPGFTVWDELKFRWNMEYGFDVIIPVDYFNGEYDNIYQSHPSYVSSKLQPPDYKELVK